MDLAPTWLGLAGLAKPSGMDGRSIAPLLIDPTAAGVPTQTVAHIDSLAPAGTKAFADSWRKEVFIE